MLATGLALAVLGGAYLFGALLRRLHRLPTPADEFHTAPTGDGWGLALYRYLPPGRRRLECEPVVLCHGLLSNRFNLDLDEEHSLARFLRQAGFDVWLMELRGHGGSRRLGTRGNRPYDWTIDDYVRRDFPAVVDYVRHRTGARAVHWVGHSLGGMILYAACALGLTAPIRSAVFTDTPADFEPMRGPRRLGWLYACAVPVVPPVLLIPFVMLLGLISPGRLLPKYGIRSRRTLMRITANGLIDLGCSRVARHLVGVLARGRFVSHDGAVDYQAGIPRIHFPFLQMAAARRRTPERVARALYERAPAGGRDYLRLGRDEGFSEDYNHFTIHLGEAARREVFPRIAAFLGRHAVARDGMVPDRTADRTATVREMSQESGADREAADEAGSAPGAPEGAGPGRRIEA